MESKATAEPAASCFSTPLLARCEAPETLLLPRWKLSPSLSAHDVPGREGGERSPGCRKTALASKKKM